MITTKTMSRKIHTSAAHNLETMSRKQFSSRLYDIYSCQGSNDVLADTTFHEDVSMVEVFNSPEGLLIAVMAGATANTIHLIRVGTPVKFEVPRGMKIVPDPDSVEWGTDSSITEQGKSDVAGARC